MIASIFPGELAALFGTETWNPAALPATCQRFAFVLELAAHDVDQQSLDQGNPATELAAETLQMAPPRRNLFCNRETRVVIEDEIPDVLCPPVRKRFP